MSKYIDWGIIHGEGTIIAECDECGIEENAYEFECGDVDVDYREAQSNLRDMGWVSKKINNEWHDFCPECKRKFINKTRA